MAPPPGPVALDAPPRPEAPVPGARRRRSWPQRLVLIGAIVVLLGILVAIAGVGYGIWRFNQIHKEKLNLSKPLGGPENYLIVGSDSRSVIAKSDPDYQLFKGGAAGKLTGGQRSDTIMVARIDPSHHTAQLLSFPRDLWVPIAGTGGSQRINTAYNNGAQPLIDTIQDDFGIPINHYVEVNFESFRDIVTAIGGVPMYFDTPVRDLNSGLDIRQPGCVMMNGDQALSFARSRYFQYKNARGYWVTDGTADLGRITRQQLFIRKVIARAHAKATSLDVFGTNQLVSGVVKNIKVDSGFSLGDMLSLVGDYKAFDPTHLQSYSVPATPTTTAGGAAVLMPETAQAQPILDLFRPKKRLTSSLHPDQVTLSVANASGVSGAAARASTELTALGYHVNGTGNAASNSTETTVYYGSGGEDAANLVATAVTGPAQVAEDSSLVTGQVRLVIGTDFGGIVAVGSSTTGASTTSTTPTTTAPVGHVPGQPPPGVNC